MPTLDFLTGFNHRDVISQEVLGGRSAAGVTVDTATVRRTGGSALKLAGSAALAYQFYYPFGFPAGLGFGTIFTGVCYVNFSVLPTASQTVFSFHNVGDGGVGFDFSTGKFCAFTRTSATSVESFLNAGGPVVATGVWYRLDFRVNFGANPWLIDVQVAVGDGAATALTQATLAQAATVYDSASPVWGDANTARTLTMFATDFASSHLSADYPIGPITVPGYSPNGVGTHSLDAATSQFFFTETLAPPGGTTAALTTSDTTSYQNIDDVPVNADDLAVKVQPITTFSVISRVGQASQASTGLTTTPTHLAGDLILVFAYRNASATAPTVPAAFTSLGSTSAAGGNAHSAVLAYRIADGTASDNVTGFTNATLVSCIIFRNAATPRNVVLQANASGTTINYPALTVSDHSHSWVAAFAGASAAGAITAPTGMTNETLVNASPSVGGHDTEAIRATDWPSTSVTVATQYSAVAVVEILAKSTVTEPTNTWYAEYLFGDESTLTSAPLAVRATCIRRTDTGAASTWVAKLFDGAQGTNTEDIDNANITNIGRGAAAKTFGQRPNTGGVWTVTALNGLRLRFGFTALADGHPRLDAAMLEAAYVPSVATLPPGFDKLVLLEQGINRSAEF